MFGVSIGPPYEAIAENPTSSSTTYTTLAAPSGALGGSKGDQSGTESRMSTSILPLNGWLMVAPSVSAADSGSAGAHLKAVGRRLPDTRRAVRHPDRMILRTRV